MPPPSQQEFSYLLGLYTLPFFSPNLKTYLPIRNLLIPKGLHEAAPHTSTTSKYPLSF